MGKKKKTKERKGKRPRSKSKHKNIQVWKMYESGKIKGKWCPRCGPGVLLAQHKDRVTCGKCGYSEMRVEKK
ncbi:MAG: 30S ribosomal protein S27ae [Candidatus Aenigmarchaeota archaeon]|nr:30S ribosomal protein S27ae [Candidatus Aenigmarchaeota archaeon]